MNYIHKLQNRVRELETEKAEARDALLDLLIYLNSDKFKDDPTVQTQDIRNRLGDERILNIMMSDYRTVGA